MAVLTPPHALGAAGQVLSGRLLRHNLSASVLPSTAVAVRSGVLVGPANTNGELTLPTALQCTVQPFHAVVQNTQDLTAGAYLVTNDAAVTLAVTAQHATQFRKSLVVIEVNDSQTAGVASSATTDRARLYLLDGALAATAGAAALPATPANALLLGEILIPPTGQTVTLTPYSPRTVIRGQVWPVTDEAARIAIPSTDRYPGLEVLALSTGRVWLWNGVKWLFTTGPLPSVTARKAGAGTLAINQWTQWTFDTLVEQTLSADAMWAIGAPSNFVAPIDGIYMATASLGIAEGHGTASNFCGISFNGNLRRGPAGYHPNVNTPGEFGFSTKGALAAGQVAWAHSYNPTGSVLNTGAGELNPRFELTWIGNY